MRCGSPRWHPFVTEQPHRIGALAYICSHAGVWRATGWEIVQHFLAQQQKAAWVSRALRSAGSFNAGLTGSTPRTEPQQVHLKALASGKHDAATGFSITYSAPDTDGTDNLLESSALAATRF
jgi:hypothetical protein